MKRTVSILVGMCIAAVLLLLPAKDVNAATDGYVLKQQAVDLYNQSLSERDDARRAVNRQRDRIDELKNRGVSGGELDDAYRELDDRYKKLDKKEDKVSRAQKVLDFVNTRTDSEIFLASMQEKFKNQASLRPMQDKIDGAKAIISAQTTQIQVIQQAIQSQTALAQVNPAIFAQVQELDKSYQQELLQLQAEQQELAHLQEQYAQFAATMPMPTVQDNIKLAEIRSDFTNCCREFDAACAE